MISSPLLAERTLARAHLRLFGLVLLVIAQGTPAAAQTRLYGVTTSSCVLSGCLSGRLIDIDVERLAVRVSPLEGGSVWSTPLVTADGSYVVVATSRGGPFSLDAVDTTTHGQWSSPMPMPNSPYTYFTHPSAVRAFAQRRDTRQILVVEPARIAPLPTPPDAGDLTAMSGDGSRLFATRFSPTTRSDVLVIDAASGAVAATILGGGAAILVNDDGSEMYGWRPSDGAPTMFDRRAVPSGTIMASTGLNRNTEVARDPRTGRLWTIYQGQLRVLDGQSLALVGTVDLPVVDGVHPIAFDPDAPTAYVSNHDVLQPGRRPRFLAINTVTLAVEAAADLGVDGLGQLIGLAIGPRPPRLSNLAAVVTGPTVTLSWTNAANRSLATHLVVEAGSAQGLTNLARLVVSAGSTSFTVTDVPRGTYFVRLRAVNGTGQGVPTSDVTVVVP